MQSLRFVSFYITPVSTKPPASAHHWKPPGQQCYLEPGRKHQAHRLRKDSHSGWHVGRIWKPSSGSTHRPGLREMMPDFGQNFTWLPNLVHSLQNSFDGKEILPLHIIEKRTQTTTYYAESQTWRTERSVWQLLSCYWCWWLTKTGSFTIWWAASRSRFGYYASPTLNPVAHGLHTGTLREAHFHRESMFLSQGLPSPKKKARFRFGWH